MKSSVKHVFSGGLAVAVLGAVLAAIGGARTLQFILTMHRYQNLKPLQMTLLLIIPHVLMLAGAGFMVGGVIMVARRIVIDMRMSYRPEDADEIDDQEEEQESG